MVKFAHVVLSCRRRFYAASVEGKHLHSAVSLLRGIVMLRAIEFSCGARERLHLAGALDL